MYRPKNPRNLGSPPNLLPNGVALEVSYHAKINFSDYMLKQITHVASRNNLTLQQAIELMVTVGLDITRYATNSTRILLQSEDGSELEYDPLPAPNRIEQ